MGCPVTSQRDPESVEHVTHDSVVFDDLLLLASVFKVGKFGVTIVEQDVVGADIAVDPRALMQRVQSCVG